MRSLISRHQTQLWCEAGLHIKVGKPRPPWTFCPLFLGPSLLSALSLSSAILIPTHFYVSKSWNIFLQRYSNEHLNIKNQSSIDTHIVTSLSFSSKKLIGWARRENNHIQLTITLQGLKMAKAFSIQLYIQYRIGCILFTFCNLTFMVLGRTMDPFIAQQSKVTAVPKM